MVIKRFELNMQIKKIIMQNKKIKRLKIKLLKITEGQQKATKKKY